ncbi:COLGALT1 [Symbiodinium sp. CCMP2456]|nr:COLGALT1 [Symbiodinium sp. CCMP2456]
MAPKKSAAQAYGGKMKKPASSKVQKRPAAAKAALKRPAAAKQTPAKKAKTVATDPVLQELRAWVVNLERRPDRWKRVATMLKKELPWLSFERFLASDGSKMTIPEEDIAVKWSTSRNALFADYFEWVFEDGSPWMWAADAPEEDDDWIFHEEGPEFSYVRDAPSFDAQPPRKGTVTKKSTGEKFQVRLSFAQRFRDGQEQLMSGGERGCAHSHLRLWRLAAEREQPTLVLEDDVHLTFDRNGDLGKMNGKVFTDRLTKALQRVPSDFDVVYLGWSGWRGGNFMHLKEESEGTLSAEDRQFVRKAEYVWTTVAYVLSQAGAKKLLLAASTSVNQPVDNFMAYEASQGKLNSYVCLDEGDEDSTWAGGIVDQFDFQGDSDIKKTMPQQGFSQVTRNNARQGSQGRAAIMAWGWESAWETTSKNGYAVFAARKHADDHFVSCSISQQRQAVFSGLPIAVGRLRISLVADRRDAINEVVLEGGEGDAVYFQRVLPGSRAAKLGVQKGDEVLQVNLIDPEILFWRPAEEILPAIVGPVMLKWRRRPPQKSGERTRINSKPVKLLWHDDEEELQDVIPEYPKSRAEALGDGEWLCGSCGAKNFDTQEHCRRCGLRDSRLPKRPGPQPRRHVDLQRSLPAVSFGRVEVDKQAVKHAASARSCDVIGVYLSLLRRALLTKAGQRL